MVVSDGKHDLHMLTASCPAGSALPMVGVSYQRSGWEWPRCLGAEAEGHLGAFEQVRMRMKSETSESSSTLPDGPGVVLWSLLKVVKREDIIVDEYDLSGGDANRNAGATACGLRRAVLDLSIGACSSMPRHTLQPLARLLADLLAYTHTRATKGPFWASLEARCSVGLRRRAPSGSGRSSCIMN